MCEAKTFCFRAPRHRALTAEKNFVGHLPERKTKCERGSGHHRRTMQHAAERFRELAIAHRLW